MEYATTRYGISGPSLTRPSFLEVLAHESTSSLLPGFLRYIISKSGSSRLVQNKEELVLAILSFINAYCLWKHSINSDGSLTEYFYGFCRSSSSSARLHLLQIIASLFEIVGWPHLRDYLKDKLETYPEAKKRQLKIGLMIIEGLSAVFRLGYIYGKTDFWSFFMWISGQKYTKPERSRAASLMPMESWLGTGLFLIRFVEWWNTQSGLNDSAPTDGDAATIPPPPVYAGASKKGKCCLCKGWLHEPLMSVPSGMAFCSVCILAHVQDGKPCPVTGDPLTAEDLLPIL